MSEVKKEVKKEEFEIRDMDRDQIKSLRKAGFDPQFCEVTAKTTAGMIDWILDNVYADADFKGVPYHKLVSLAGDTYKKAYGGPDAIKN